MLNSKQRAESFRMLNLTGESRCSAFQTSIKRRSDLILPGLRPMLFRACAIRQKTITVWIFQTVMMRSCGASSCVMRRVWGLFFQAAGFAGIRRVYIRLAYRGSKPGEPIIAAIETMASENRSRELRPETGIHQQPAIALYRRCGYALSGSFTPDEPDPLSVFMCKRLS